MDLFSNEVRTLLNNLDDYIPKLINQKALNIIQRNVIIDINGFILFGNEYAILNRIAQLVVKNMFHIPTLTNFRMAHFNPMKETEGQFILSDYHMEFELSERALEYIKSVITNRTISSRNFVFIIKNAEPLLNRNLYLALRRIIDMNSTSKFIITTSSLSFIEKSLLSRVLPLNCTFPFDMVKECDIINQIKNDITPKDMQEFYVESQGNIITLIQHLSTKCERMLWQKSIDKLIDTLKTEKKQLIVIMSVRELVYKLYHVGVGMKDVCRYVITHHITSKTKNTHQIIALAAHCDHAITQGNKDILLFEQFFLKLYKIL